MDSPAPAFNARILAALDASENSRRAVLYLSGVLAAAPGFEVSLVHIINEPDPDYFTKPAERLAWVRERHAEAGLFMGQYRAILEAGGFPAQRIEVQVREMDCPSLSECILKEQERQGASTIVVGRKGRGAREELLLGSVSKRIVHHAKNCAVWVVT